MARRGHSLIHKAGFASNNTQARDFKAFLLISDSQEKGKQLGDKASPKVFPSLENTK